MGSPLGFLISAANTTHSSHSSWQKGVVAGFCHSPSVSTDSCLHSFVCAATTTSRQAWSVPQICHIERSSFLPYVFLSLLWERLFLDHVLPAASVSLLPTLAQSSPVPQHAVSVLRKVRESPPVPVLLQSLSCWFADMPLAFLFLSTFPAVSFIFPGN